MKQSQSLYEYLYQVLIAQFLNGAFQQGQDFPSQQELCRQYNVGITTVRKVVKMLNEQGYIRTAQGHPSVVTYQSSIESRAAYLVQRQDEIADAYRGLELVMPDLYCEGAKQCKEPELKRLHEVLNSVSDKMELFELYGRANAFFMTLLQPLGNQLIMDLELDSENYLRVPYISLPGVKNPFALTADRLKFWLQKAIRKIENKQFECFCADAKQLYRESEKRVDDYLSILGHYTPAVQQTKEDVRWFRIKGHSELYAHLAMDMIRRIVNGEFDGQKYLPSIPKLMQEYGIMKDTASRAITMLNTLGVVQTIDKKGTIITTKDTIAVKSDIDLAEPVIQERLSLFKDALQIVTLTARSCAASFSFIPENSAPLIEARLRTAPDSWISPLSFQLLMSSFIQLIPHHSLKNIFQQLEELILWGYYLQTVDRSFYPDTASIATAMKVVVTALKNRDYAGLPDAFGSAFSLIYSDASFVMDQLEKVEPK